MGGREKYKIYSLAFKEVIVWVGGEIVDRKI